MAKELGPRYLGDGVYVQTRMADGTIVLTTGSHRLSEAENTIYLEPSVIYGLIKYDEERRLLLQQEIEGDRK